MSEIIPPWLEGLVSTLQGSCQLEESRIFCRGRLALILLDTVFETGSYVFLDKISGWKQKELGELADQRKRIALFEAVKTEAERLGRKIPDEIWQTIRECHNARNELAHRSPNTDISTRSIAHYHKTAIAFMNR